MADTPSSKPRRGAGRVAFLARLDQFKTLIEAGNEQRTVYDDCGGEDELRYQLLPVQPLRRPVHHGSKRRWTPKERRRANHPAKPLPGRYRGRRRTSRGQACPSS